MIIANAKGLFPDTRLNVSSTAPAFGGAPLLVLLPRGIPPIAGRPPPPGGADRGGGGNDACRRFPPPPPPRPTFEECPYMTTSVVSRIPRLAKLKSPFCLTERSRRDEESHQIGYFYICFLPFFVVFLLLCPLTIDYFLMKPFLLRYSLLS